MLPAMVLAAAGLVAPAAKGIPTVAWLEQEPLIITGNKVGGGRVAFTVPHVGTYRLAAIRFEAPVGNGDR